MAKRYRRLFGREVLLYEPKCELNILLYVVLDVRETCPSRYYRDVHVM